LVEQPFSAFSESIRLTLTALRPAGAPAAAETVMLTSSVPEEGKTTLAACLAVVAAAAGYRTLLIDGDLRRPTVQRVLGLPDHPGVVEHLCGGVALADAIVDGPVANLKVLGAGRLTVDPLRLLSGPPLRALLDEARRDYDQVIIDSSPVLGVSDAQNLARAVDRVVLVVQWDRTPRSLVASATQTLKKSGVPVAGVVLTQVDVRRHARYGYGDVGDVLHRYRKYYTR
jgi:capsular exopolysaccharide synthesis family protein